MPRQMPRRRVLTGGAGALVGLLAGGALAGYGGAAGSDARPSGSMNGDLADTSTHGVRSATGTVEVPLRPQRVVVLDPAALDSALTLGVTPVGATHGSAGTAFPGYWPGERFSKVTCVGPAGRPDLGAVARLKPDLILSNRADDGARLDELSAIAPTVLTENTGSSWKQDFRTHAQALGRQQAADLVGAVYTQHVQQAGRALARAGNPRNPRNQRISLLRFVQGGTPRLYATQTFLGVLLADLRLGRPPSQAVAAADVPLTDTATLTEADGSVLFYATCGDPARAGTLALTRGRAWGLLGAVRSRHAFAVDDELWFQGIGYTGAHLVLAQLQKFLVG